MVKSLYPFVFISLKSNDSPRKWSNQTIRTGQIEETVFAFCEIHTESSRQDEHWIITRLSSVHCFRNFENNFVKGSAVGHKNGDSLATGRCFVYALEIRSHTRTKKVKDSIKLMRMSKGY